ncbi:uncharacterized protein LOC110978880 [Acanthaster planci]|uniref:Uncharacterized protein LOC110978880 n=1 Tax=Acanthaster planci TaxID=133434 RepID=A0A8B7YE34_ACAPL|nr:uncharacterized protein LOC110978880 [Acanthaster planci]
MDDPEVEEVRLVGGPETTPNAGRVEFRRPGSAEWFSVCADDWGFPEGQVVCRELGFPGTSTVKTESEYGDRGMGKSIAGFQCEGEEESLMACMNGTDERDDPCGDSHTAGVVCTAPGYKGCFSGDGDAIFHDLVTMDEITIEKCVYHAKMQVSNDKSIVYAAMERKQCLYRLKDPNINENTRVIDSTCNHACAGNPDQRCGGEGVISIYSVNESFCSDPGNLAHGELTIRPTADHFYFGSIINFTCNPGFGLQGALSVQCVKGPAPAQIMWSETSPECVATGLGTAPPVTDRVDVGLVLGILNTALLGTLILVILIGLYCCVFRARRDSPAVPPRYTRTNSLPRNGLGEDVRKSAAGHPASRPQSTVQDLPEYSAVDQDAKRTSTASKTNSGFMDELDLAPGRPVYSLVMKDRGSRASESEDIFGEIMVNPPSLQQEGEWVENEMYEAVELEGPPGDNKV